MFRLSIGAHSIITDPDTHSTGQRWEPPSGWPATWSHGEQPSPLPTCTTGTAWLTRMARSAQLCVFDIFLCYWVIFVLRTGPHLLLLPLALSSCPGFRMCQWDSITSREDQKGKLIISRNMFLVCIIFILTYLQCMIKHTKSVYRDLLKTFCVCE